MTDGESAIANVGLEVRGEPEQSQRIGDGGPAFPDFGRGFVLLQFELFDQLGEAVGLLDGVEVFALEILDEREFQYFAIVGFTDNDGNFREAGDPRSAPASFAGDQFVGVALGPDDEGLDNALFLDGVGQFPQGFLIEFLARLKRAGADAG
jgi:hypothetical protein